jgi:hypothetical protein
MQPTLNFLDHCTAVEETLSTTVQIEIISSTSDNQSRYLENTASFIGSDHECDLVLNDNRFPPIYAFLLADHKGVVLRYLGCGPELHVDGKPIERVVITDSAHVIAGPFSFTLRVSPTVPQADDGLQMYESAERAREDPAIKLIEQASCLLSSIGQQADRNASSGRPHCTKSTTRGQSTPTGYLTVSPSSLKLSIGLPPATNITPAWKHLCL